MFIKDKKIERISGPVSLSLLKPKKGVFQLFKKKGIHLPIFMLFGDIHKSRNYQCEECFCKVYGKDCCMPIYSDEFLRLIDSVATDENPIDLNLEHYNSTSLTETIVGLHNQGIPNLDLILKNLKGEHLKGKENEPMEELRTNYVCFMRELRGTDAYKACPTKNIRWHYIDPRQASSSKYNLESLIQGLITQLKTIIEKFQANEDLTEEQFKDAIIKASSKFPSIDIFNEVITMFMYMASRKAELAMEVFFNIATPRNSLVMKQLYKISPNNANFIKFLQKSCSEYLSYLLKVRDDAEPKKIVDEYIEANTNLYTNIIYAVHSNNYSHIYNRLKNDKAFIKKIDLSDPETLRYSLFYLDLYYIFRTLKVPKGGKNPFLSIGLFGNLHVKQITHFLVNIIKMYDIVSEVDNNYSGSFRCLNMPDINLNELFFEYGINFKSKLQPSQYIRRSPTRKTSARKTSVRRSPSRKTSVRRSPSRKTSARRAPARKTSVRRAPARRSPARRRK